MENRILGLNTGLAPEDPRAVNELSVLERDLRNEGIEMRRDTEGSQGKGLITDLILLLPAAGPSVAAMVSAFRAWVNRDSRNRSIDIDVNGRTIHADARAIGSEDFRAVCEAALKGACARGSGDG